MNAVNLIPRACLERRALRRRRHAWCVIGAGCLTLIVGGFAAAGAALSPGAPYLGDDLDALNDANSAQDIAIRSLAARVAETERRAAAIRQVVVRPDWSLLLALLARDSGDSIVLRSVAVDAAERRGPGGTTTPGYDIELTGLGRDQDAVAAFLGRLETCGLFDELRLNSTSRTELRDQSVIDFEIVAAIRPGGGTSP